MHYFNVVSRGVIDKIFHVTYAFKMECLISGYFHIWIYIVEYFCLEQPH